MRESRRGTRDLIGGLFRKLASPESRVREGTERTHSHTGEDESDIHVSGDGLQGAATELRFKENTPTKCARTHILPRFDVPRHGKTAYTIP